MAKKKGLPERVSKRTKKKTRTRATWPDPKDRVDWVLVGKNKAPRCSSPKKRTDPPQRCKKPAVHGRSVCRSHGGASTGGPIRHGLYMQALGPLREAFANHMEDPGLRDTSRGLATMDAWFGHLMQLADEGDGTGFRAKAVELFGDLDSAIRGGEPAALAGALLALRRHLESGDKSLRTMKEAMAVADRRQAHTTQALAVELRADQVVNQKVLLSVLNAVARIILREVPDDARRVVTAVTTEVLEGRAPGAGLGRLGEGLIEAG